MAYNISTLNSTDPHLVRILRKREGCAGWLIPHFRQVIDRATLALIWAGNITTWNHQAIRDLNPGIAAKLPSANILIGYDENSAYTTAEVVKRSLESFSPVFRSALAAANRTFAGLPPAQSGNAVAAGSSTALRIKWLAVRMSCRACHLRRTSLM
jgi:hypothetical protein